jgi:hypothetical protein
MAKPVDMSELRARVASLLQMKYFTDGLDSAQAVMLSLAMTIEGRDPSAVPRAAIAAGCARHRPLSP